MIRTRNEIDDERQMIKHQLEDTIDESVEEEEYYGTKIKLLQKQLRDLNDEICFENTIAGQMQMLEMEADEKIKQVLKELSQKTGYNYIPEEEFLKKESLKDEALREVLNADKA